MRTPKLTAPSRVARSPLIGMADDELDDLLSAANQDHNLLKSLSISRDNLLGSLADRWLDLSQSDRIVQMLEETLDHWIS